MARPSRASKAEELERRFTEEIERARAQLREELKASYEMRGARLAVQELLEVGAIHEDYAWAVRRYLDHPAGISQLWIDGRRIVPPGEPGGS